MKNGKLLFICFFIVIGLVILPLKSNVIATTSNWTDENNYDISWYTDSKNSFAISSDKEFAGLCHLVNSGTTFQNKSISLSHNLDMKDKLWTPIGKMGKFFEGSFDGNNHIISGIDCTCKTNGGLFGAISNAEIKNVILINSKFSGARCIGSIAGYISNSSITNCVYQGKIDCSSCFAGGICGSCYSNKGECVISDCTSFAEINCPKNSAGIVGCVKDSINGVSSVKNCNYINDKSCSLDKAISALIERDNNVSCQYEECSYIGDKTVINCNDLTNCKTFSDIDDLESLDKKVKIKDIQKIISDYCKPKPPVTSEEKKIITTTSAKDTTTSENIASVTTNTEKLTLPESQKNNKPIVTVCEPKKRPVKAITSAQDNITESVGFGNLLIAMPTQTIEDKNPNIHNKNDFNDFSQDIIIKDTSMVSKELLDEVYQTDRNIIVDLGYDMSWEIKGTDIKNKKTNTNISLDVNFLSESNHTQAINQNDFLSLEEFNINHDGEFPFTATLTIPMGEEFKNHIVNLYYLSPNGQTILQKSSTINDHGNAKLEFTHASNYIIGLSKNTDISGSASTH